MPIGSADWYKSGLTANIPGSADNAELAVRLGSPVSFDRTGKLLYADYMLGYKINRTVVVNGVIPLNYISNEKYETGASSLKWQGITGVNGSGYVTFNSRIWPSERVSIEAGIASDRVPSVIILSMSLSYNGVSNYFAARLANYGFDVDYKIEGSTWLSAFDGIRTMYVLDSFNSIKFDVNLVSKELLRFRCNDKIIDFVNAVSVDGVAALPNQIIYYVQCLYSSQGSYDGYLDRVLITEDE